MSTAPAGRPTPRGPATPGLPPASGPDEQLTRQPAPHATTPGRYRAVVRVLSYNVHRWGDDREALARVVRACRAEVMLVQEAPTWWGTGRKRRAMAASFGMSYVAGSARNAILVADGMELTGERHWRVWRPFVRRRLRLIATQLPGGAVGGLVALAGVELALVGCHLGLHLGGRQRELEQVLRGCRAFGLPYLLVGDLNEEPGGPVWNRLAAEGLVDLGAENGPTFPSSNPERRIDGVHLSPDGVHLTPDGVHLSLDLTGRVIPLDSIEGVTRADLAAASDHLPLLIELRAGSSAG